MTSPNSPSGPSNSTVKQLFALSSNRCAFPKCDVTLVQGNSIVGEICHIKAAKPNGPRYDPTQTLEERHSFPNLVLMCAVHHKVIDDDPESYTVERLYKLKQEHIAGGAELESSDEIETGARLLIAQTVSSTAQTGGIIAHTVNQTINLHHRADKAQEDLRQEEAKKHLAPELQRTIERMLYIHGRTVANFICHSADNGVKPNDEKKDFLPCWPSLYPNAPEVRELSCEDRSALVVFYDSLHRLNDQVNDWWQREGQMPFNIFNCFRDDASKSLKLALICIERFRLEELFPPPYEAWGTLSSRINQSLRNEHEAMKHHLARYEAKPAKGMIPAITPPASRIGARR